MTQPIQTIRKAVIPAAGFGTRLFPATKVVKKEFFPLIDREGRAKPILQIIVEEALSAGIESVGIVAQPEDHETFTQFFQALPSGTYAEKIQTKYGDYLPTLDQLGQRITLLSQNQQAGFGHAVFCARDWVGDEPFLLLLGDHVYASGQPRSCAQQMVDCYQQVGTSVIGIETCLAADIAHRGCITGIWQEASDILEVTKLTEKPAVDYALQHLHVPDMPTDQLLAVFGMYVLTPKIFDCLADSIADNRQEFGEFQLTSCLDQLRDMEGMAGCLVNGKAFDTGLPTTYRQTMIDFYAT